MANAIREEKTDERTSNCLRNPAFGPEQTAGIEEEETGRPDGHSPFRARTVGWGLRRRAGESWERTLRRSIIPIGGASIPNVSPCSAIMRMRRMPRKKFFSNCSGKRIPFEVNRAFRLGCTV